MSIKSVLISLVQETAKIAVSTAVLGPQKLSQLSSSFLSRWAARTYLTPPVQEHLAVEQLGQSVYDTLIGVSLYQQVNLCLSDLGIKLPCLTAGLTSGLQQTLKSALPNADQPEFPYHQMGKEAVKAMIKAYVMSSMIQFISDSVLQEDDDPYANSQLSAALGGMAGEIIWHYGSQAAKTLSTKVNHFNLEMQADPAAVKVFQYL